MNSPMPTSSRAKCECRRVGLDAERHLVRMFADTLCELEIKAIAERMIAPSWPPKQSLRRVLNDLHFNVVSLAC
jgi:hypothetical protein